MKENDELLVQNTQKQNVFSPGPLTLTSRQSVSRSACGGVRVISAALRCCRVHSLRSTPPSIAMGSKGLSSVYKREHELTIYTTTKRISSCFKHLCVLINGDYSNPSAQSTLSQLTYSRFLGWNFVLYPPLTSINHGSILCLEIPS